VRSESGSALGSPLAAPVLSYRGPQRIGDLQSRACALSYYRDSRWQCMWCLMERRSPHNHPRRASLRGACSDIFKIATWFRVAAHHRGDSCLFIYLSTTSHLTRRGWNRAKLLCVHVSAITNLHTINKHPNTSIQPVTMVGRLAGKNAIVTGAAGYDFSHSPHGLMLCMPADTGLRTVVSVSRQLSSCSRRARPSL
jgi:hypothetical protein